MMIYLTWAFIIITYLGIGLSLMNDFLEDCLISDTDHTKACTDFVFSMYQQSHSARYLIMLLCLALLFGILCWPLITAFNMYLTVQTFYLRYVVYFKSIYRGINADISK